MAIRLWDAKARPNSIGPRPLFVSTCFELPILPSDWIWSLAIKHWVLGFPLSLFAWSWWMKPQYFWCFLNTEIFSSALYETRGHFEKGSNAVLICFEFSFGAVDSSKSYLIFLSLGLTYLYKLGGLNCFYINGRFFKF